MELCWEEDVFNEMAAPGGYESILTCRQGVQADEQMTRAV